jgi:hypothetical protein
MKRIYNQPGATDCLLVRNRFGNDRKKDEIAAFRFTPRNDRKEKDKHSRQFSFKFPPLEKEGQGGFSLYLRSR